MPGQTVEKVGDQLRSWIAERISPLVEHSPCMTEAFDRPAGLMRNGGTGPAAMLAEKIAPVLFFGTGPPEDLWHDGDERADLDTLRRGAVALALLWPRLPDTGLGRH